MSKIEERVMANVTLIYAARILTSATALKLYALILSAAGLVAFVSISNVVANLVKVAEGGVGSVAIFAVSAVLGTTLVVQLVLAIAAAAAISLVVPAVFRTSGRSFA